MEIEYRVVVRGGIPADLRERVTRLHAEAILLNRSIAPVDVVPTGSEEPVQDDRIATR